MYYTGVFISFLVAVIKYPGEGSYGRRVCFGSWFHTSEHRGREPQWQGPEGAGLVTSTVKNRAADALSVGALLSVSMSPQPGIPV